MFVHGIFFWSSPSSFDLLSESSILPRASVAEGDRCSCESGCDGSVKGAIERHVSSLQMCHDSCGQPQISTPAVSQNMSWCLLTWHREAKSSKTRKRLIEQDLCLNQNHDCGWRREWSHLSLWKNRYLIDQCCSVCFRQRSINTHKHIKYAANCCYLSCF